MILNIGGGGGLPIRLIVTAPTGSAVSVTRGTTVLAANEVDGVWTFAIPSLGVWTIHATIDGQSLTQNVDISKVGQYNVTLEAPIKATLNDNDWSTIRDVADVSEGANYWSVGDTKEIIINGKLSDGLTLSNYSTWVYIIGFDHNKDVEGTGIAFQGFKTAQSNGTDICLCDSGYSSNKPSGQWFNMNNNNSTSGGWNGCNMRNNTLPVVKVALPTDLKSVIKTTMLYTDNTGGGSDVASYVTQTQDELYLLAEFEIFGSRRYANTAEQNYQMQYAYYVAGNSKVKYKHNSTATAAHWWGRSVYATSANSFCFVDTSGTATFNFANISIGLAPAFKVGSNPPPQPISALSVGSSVFFNVGGVKTEYIIVHKGNPDETIYDSSCNGVWAVCKNIPNNSLAWRSMPYVIYSDSLAGSWPNTTYYGTIDSGIKQYIKTAKLPYTTYSGGNFVSYNMANGMEQNCFLLSWVELGGSVEYPNTDRSSDGAALSYFSGQPDSIRIAKYGNNAFDYWTRSVWKSGEDMALAVSYSGGGLNPTCTTQIGMRPALIFDNNTPIDSSNNIIT